MSDYVGEVVKKILEEYGVEPIDQEVNRLRAENTALREIVAAVAGLYPDGRGDNAFPGGFMQKGCAFCQSRNLFSLDMNPPIIQLHHISTCPVTRARAATELYEKESRGGAG